MKLIGIEQLDPEAYTYKATIERRTAPRWKFWNSTTIKETYVGNSLGWYNPSTGAKVKIPEVYTLLDNAVRRDYLQSMLKDHKPKLTPIK